MQILIENSNLVIFYEQNSPHHRCDGAGIGKATAELFAKNGIDLILWMPQRAARRIAANARQPVKVSTLSFDVRNREAVFAAIDSLPDHWKSIDILVNNVGNAHGLDTGKTPTPTIGTHRRHERLTVCDAHTLPGMIAKNDGHIVNIGSIAGEQVASSGAVVHPNLRWTHFLKQRGWICSTTTSG
ncbi:MAG: SDR family NAD(P)-dependent oxidoreductase [Calditrichia bacterium]